MKISSIHPEFYLRHKYSRFESFNTFGIVTGYYISKNGKVNLIVEIDKKNPSSSLKEFIKRTNVEIQDYRGDINNIFFIMSLETIKLGVYKLIE